MINNSFELYDNANIEDLADKFLSERARKDSRQRFLIFLGAGASRDSQIPLASELINQFINDICKQECPDLTDDVDKEKWVKSYFKSEEDKYSSLFEKCHRTEIERREKIVSVIKGKDPSIGYIILAHLIKKKYVDTVITTNFDDLVYQACTTYADIRPTVFSLGGFSSEINFESDHPKVIKIHGDFMFSKLANTRKELKKTDPNMAHQVIQMFNDYKGVIVIGYAGNDKSVKRLFRRLPDNKYLFWCNFEGSKINEELTFLDKKKENRYVVPINGFDKLMIDICRLAGIKNEEIISPSIKRFRKFIRSFRDFGLNRTELTDSEKQKLDKSMRRQYGKISRSFDVVQYFILGDKAYFNKNYEEAKNFYLKAIDKKKNEADSYYNYAKVLSEHPHYYDEALKNFEKAIELNPKDFYTKNRLANLLVKLNKDEDAEDIYKEVLAKNVDHFFANFEYGNLLAKKRKYKSAEEHYRKAITINSRYAEVHYRLGKLFLDDVSKKDEVRKLFEEAVEIKPDFAAAYFQLHRLSKDNKDYRTELNIEEKYSKYRDQFYDFSIKSAVDFKMLNNSLDPEKLGAAKKLQEKFFGKDVYKKAQIEFLSGNDNEGFTALESAVKANPSYKDFAKWDLSMFWIYENPKFQEILK